MEDNEIIEIQNISNVCQMKEMINKSKDLLIDEAKNVT
jgi:hypothetical protein